MERTLEDWVELAKQGNQAALEIVIGGIWDRVYGQRLRKRESDRDGMEKEG